MKTDRLKKSIHLSNREKKTILAFLILMFAINIIGLWLDKDAEIIILNAENGIPLDSLSLLTSNDHYAFASVPRTDKPTKTQQKKMINGQVSKYKELPLKNSDVRESPKKIPTKRAKKKSKINENFSIKSSFDPNSVSPDEMIELGIPKRIAQNIFNYRKSGGHFKSKEDLLKMYNIDEKQYQIMQKYISIAPSENSASHSMIDVNSADQKDWESLKGIGPYYAQKIIRFRNKLGGFYSIDQIKETWDLPKDVIEKNKEFLLIEDEPKKLDLKRTNFKELIAHPYIDKKETKLLLKLKDITDKIDDRVFIDIFGTNKWGVMKNYLEY